MMSVKHGVFGYASCRRLEYAGLNPRGIAMASVTVTTSQGSSSYELRQGLGLQALCARHKTALEFDCRKADCGICLLRVEAGADALSPPTPAERDFLKAMRADPDERLACQCRVLGDVRLVVPDP
jgi:ferredoxin